MPRATTQRFGNAQSAAAGPSKPAASKEAGQGGNNPLFNTEKFGQHILKVSRVFKRLV
jgi:18S rRNA (adenine1779-N6/adenine1780-N6)-dimethyltransferase